MLFSRICIHGLQFKIAQKKREYQKHVNLIFEDDDSEYSSIKLELKSIEKFIILSHVVFTIFSSLKLYKKKRENSKYLNLIYDEFDDDDSE